MISSDLIGQYENEQLEKRNQIVDNLIKNTLLALGNQVENGESENLDEYRPGLSYILGSKVQISVALEKSLKFFANFCISSDVSPEPHYIQLLNQVCFKLINLSFFYHFD